MRGVIWRVRGEFASFRPFYLTSIVETYPFPPKTVVVGMVGAACGFSEQDLIPLYDALKVGIEIVSIRGYYNDLVRIWKVFSRTDIKRQLYVIVKRFLFKPEFRLYIASEDTSLIELARKRIEDPVYPITLGDSDSLYYPAFGDVIEVEVGRVKSRRIRTLFPAKLAGGMHYDRPPEGEFLLYPRINPAPVKFEEGRKVITERILVHGGGEALLKEEVELYEFRGVPVYLF